MERHEAKDLFRSVLEFIDTEDENALDLIYDEFDVEISELVNKIKELKEYKFMYCELCK